MDQVDLLSIVFLTLYFLPAAIFALRPGEAIGSKLLFTFYNGALNWTLIGWLLLMNASLDFEG